jgi:hypothetical protein
MFQKAIFTGIFLLMASAQASQPLPTLINELPIDGMQFTYWSNRSLNQVNASVDQVVIVVHGSERNVDTYFNNMSKVLDSVHQLDHMLVIAPHFKQKEDSLLSNEVYFAPEGWLSGDPALNDDSISSFQIMDELVKLLLNKTNFPNLKTLVLTGHSAGGQFIQRFALGTRVDLSPEAKGIHFHYVAANPGSYVYLSDKRATDSADEDGTYTFETPDDRHCDFNDYKYGLDNLNSYMSQVNTALKIKHYLLRDITYLQGEADIRTDEGLDQSCEAEYQGETRFDRARKFKAALDVDFPQNKQMLKIIPNVDHTEFGMYSSSIGLSTLLEP